MITIPIQNSIFIKRITAKVDTTNKIIGKNIFLKEFIFEFSCSIGIAGNVLRLGEGGDFYHKC